MIKLCVSLLDLFIVQATILVGDFMALRELSEFLMDVFMWLCNIFDLVVIALMYFHTDLFFLFLSFFAHRLNFTHTHLSQLDQRVPLYLTPYLAHIIWLVHFAVFNCLLMVYSLYCVYLGFTPIKVEQPPQGMEL